ncbi:MAG: hypothetical protein QOF68_1730 [Gaiellales bacterium]|jgi:hypothetical protein|nr:hypothetical protein [Gaiellales bacterium]
MAHRADSIPLEPVMPTNAKCWCGEAVAPHHATLCERHAYLEGAWADDSARWRRGKAA